MSQLPQNTETSLVPVETKFFDDIVPVFKKFKKEQVQLFDQVKRRSWITWAGAGLGIIGICMMPANFVVFGTSFLITGFLVAIVNGLMGYFKKRKFTRGFQERLKKMALDKMIGDLDYRPKGMIPEKDASNSKLFRGWDVYSGEDLIRGTWEGYKFRFSELKLQDRSTRTDSNGNTTTTYTTIFDGLFFTVALPVSLEGYYLVFQQDMSGSFWDSSVGKGLKKVFSVFNSSDRVSLQDEFYNDRFRILSDKPKMFSIEKSRGLLDTLLALNKFFGSSVRLSVIKDRLYIAVSWDKDLFHVDKIEQKELKPILEQYANELNTCMNVIRLVIPVVEDFNSNAEMGFFATERGQIDGQH